jgi:hypothetical protein
MLRGKLTDGSWKNYREYEENLPRTSGREAINADDFLQLDDKDGVQVDKHSKALCIQ